MFTSLVTERPHWPNMVEMDRLRPGFRFVKVNSKFGQSSLVYEVIGHPYHEQLLGGMATWVPCRYSYGETEVSLEDMGLIPYYPSRLWNPVNHIEEAEEAS